MDIDRTRLSDDAYRWEVVEVLLREHAEAIMRYCTKWLGEGLAEEVTQSVFVIAWEKLPRFQPTAPIRTWLFGIARNKCQQAYRNRSRRQAIDRTFLDDIRHRAHAEAAATPEHATMHEHHGMWLYDSLSQLAESDRLLLTWRYWQEMPMPEIADIMGVSEVTVRKRLERAKQRLRERVYDAARA